MKVYHPGTRPVPPQIDSSSRRPRLLVALTSLVLACVVSLTHASALPSQGGPTRPQLYGESLLNLNPITQVPVGTPNVSKPGPLGPKSLVTTSWPGMQSDF